MCTHRHRKSKEVFRSSSIFSPQFDVWHRLKMFKINISYVYQINHLILSRIKQRTLNTHQTHSESVNNVPTTHYFFLLGGNRIWTLLSPANYCTAGKWQTMIYNIRVLHWHYDIMYDFIDLIRWWVWGTHSTQIWPKKILCSLWAALLQTHEEWKTYKSWNKLTKVTVPAVVVWQQFYNFFITLAHTYG